MPALARPNGLRQDLPGSNLSVEVEDVLRDVLGIDAIEPAVDSAGVKGSQQLPRIGG
jgi:hypothetical protein